MPAILRPDAYEAWLIGSPVEAQEALAQYPAELMIAYAVGTRVNTPKNNDASLLEPVG